MKSREERMSRSTNFDWMEAAQPDHWWFGSRNSLQLMEIVFHPLRVDDDGLPYVLRSLLPGQRGFTQGFSNLKAAKDQADEHWENWVHMVGLKQGDEWWKEEVEDD